ncbi:acyltransferase family protein [Cocleimonas sp. KMM 6892]|uniref:acyltransferase family protein n=1 Tax=unclassified Cocleimonas TaxID=2639732 RepID=UPI002DBD4916|nr:MULTISPECIES: acyltransferase family protein [unclassified Cocleimonas]MEB8431780.1 acyltransferase family protein [Cocleimonas sp. KMM 6892]MEC4715134.1 acyltransferase family protein [Cocleimonas sp. KMM 6895]MEC4744052.1 acyltransferase family protein [Cocleimonas sp. KMM 6896]
MNFREDINGLRAIAVMAVMLFHFEPAWAPGGFAGVDIFFVISGFLMTGIIFKGIENDSFSILRFYAARANRIIPPLFALCATLLIIGWFVLTPADYRNLGINSAASSVFISNIIYWLESSYFAPGVENNLLLHTWSLSVEWQFYLIYPVILLFLSKFLSINNIKKLLIVITLLGFSYNLYVSVYSPSAAYYLLGSRFWEMTIGGLAFLYPITFTRKKSIEAIGLLLILASFIFVTKNDLWPGYMSLLPVVGAYLIIISHTESSPFTTNRLSLFIGKISYSIYLWHWIVHVFLFKNEYDNLYSKVFGILVSIVLGYISYSLFEKKRYKLENITFKNLITFKPLILSFAIFGLSAGIYLFNGMLNYTYLSHPEASDYISKYENYMERKDVQENYGVLNIDNRYESSTSTSTSSNIDSNLKQNDGVFLWGDSHADALAYGLEKIFKANNIKFQATTAQSCGAGLGIGANIKKKGTDDYKQCVESNTFAVDFIKTHKPSVVIFAQHKDHDLNNFNQIVDEIADKNISYIIVGPVPQWRGTLPSRIAYTSLDPKDKYLGSIRPWILPLDQKMQEKYQQNKNIRYLSLIDRLCTKDDKCLAKVDDKNSPLVWDYGHLSLEGSYYVGQNIIYPEISNLINQSAMTSQIEQ